MQFREDRLSNLIGDSADTNALRQLSIQLAAAENTFATLVSRVPLPKIKQEINCPAHTNINVQRKFYSTKSKRKQLSVKYARPTEDKKNNFLQRRPHAWLHR